MAATVANPTPLDRVREQGDVLLAAGAFGLLGIMVIPLPPVALDLLLATSISVSLLMFLAVLSTKRPAEFSAFPTLLLVVTVFRLALNVASTRLILGHGNEGSRGAGAIIEAFGHFVIGSNYAVGMVVFIILVVINFVVITKGAGRVAEVSARFTLDAMPGKQMAVDAEMNAGLIDEKTARTRRAEISREAEFYGAMDGASKFVRGDAIAGILITLVNVIGGVFIGVIQHGMPIQEALANYTLLTIGDGLVAQVPALVLSMAAGLLVTRVNDPAEGALQDQIGHQLLASPRVLYLLAGSVACFAIIPGVRLPFLAVASAAVWLSWQLREPEKAPTTTTPAPSGGPPPVARPEELLAVEPLSIEVGLDLLYLVDDRHGSELVQRIQRIRNQFATDLGVVLPPVHLRDDLKLQGGEYVVHLRGEIIGRGRVVARQHLALDPGKTAGPLKGTKTTDPVFGLPAYWVPDTMVLKAQSLGYTVVDVPTVVTTHFVELMHLHAHELFDSAQLGKLLEREATAHPRLVEDLIPDPLPRSSALRVFRNLIREGVSCRDVQTILEALSDYAPRSRDADVLTEFVRQRLARHITRRFASPENVLSYVGFAPESEDLIVRSLQAHDGAAPTLSLDPESLRRLIQRAREVTENHSGSTPPVLLAPPLARGALRRILERVLPRISVLSSAELAPSVRLERVATIDPRADPNAKKPSSDRPSVR